MEKSKENILLNIEKIIDYVYSQNFPEILIQEKSQFLKNIENQIIELLKCQYKENQIEYQKELEIYEKNKNRGLTIRRGRTKIIKHEKVYALVAQWIECPATNR